MLMVPTLKEIADAVAELRGSGSSEEERRRVYDRARTLRDKGLIHSSNSRTQGRSMTFAVHDVSAAVIAINASLNGASWGTLEVVNTDLRVAPTDPRPSGYLSIIEKIQANDPTFVRLDTILGDEPYTKATIGGLEVLSADLEPGTMQMTVWPVTTWVRPVLTALQLLSDANGATD